jgi:hypothetical protein
MADAHFGGYGRDHESNLCGDQRPFGETGVPTKATEPLPLGPLPNSALPGFGSVSACRSYVRSNAMPPRQGGDRPAGDAQDQERDNLIAFDDVIFCPYVESPGPADNGP